MMTPDSFLAPWYRFTNIQHCYTADALHWHHATDKMNVLAMKKKVLPHLFTL